MKIVSVISDVTVSQISRSWPPGPFSTLASMLRFPTFLATKSISLLCDETSVFEPRVTLKLLKKEPILLDCLLKLPELLDLLFPGL